MALPSYMTIITHLDHRLNEFFEQGVMQIYTSIAHHLQYPLGLAIVLYIVIFGYGVSQGWIALSQREFVKSALQLAFIYVAAIKWHWFSHYLIAFIQGGANEISDVIVSASKNAPIHSAGSGIIEALQSCFSQITHLGHHVWEQGSWHHITPLFSGILIWLFGFAMVLVALFEIVLAKIMLAILFSLAPLFIAFTIFKVTRQLFDRWLGLLITYALLMIFVATVMSFMILLIGWGIQTLEHEQGISAHFLDFLPIMVIGTLGIGMILNVVDLARSIGGTVATSSATLFYAAALGNAVSTPFKAYQHSQELYRQGKSTGKQMMNRVRALNGFRQRLMNREVSNEQTTTPGLD